MPTKRKSSTTGIVKLLAFLVIVNSITTKCFCNSQQFMRKTYNKGVMTAVKCFELDPSAVKINTCLLKPINRTLKIFYGHIILLKPLTKVELNFRILKKATGGFKPFGIDVTLDGCKYLAGKKNPIFDWFYKLTGLYTNINHTCPYYSDLFIKYPVKEIILPSVFPEGQYRTETNIAVMDVPRFAIHSYETIIEDDRIN